MQNKTPDIYAYAEQMAKQWKKKHKYYDHDDVWYTHNMKDINPLNWQDVNLYVAENRIIVTAYPLVYDDGNDLVIETKKMYCVYLCSWYPKQKPCKTSYTLRRNK